MDSEKDLLACVMAAAYVGLQDIGDHVYQNMVRRYRVCVEVPGCHIEPFLQVDPEVQQRTYNKQRKLESSTCDVEVFSL